MVLEAPEISQEAKPGQFLHIRIHEGLNPLLRRPFSIHRITSSQIEILYKIRGRGTEILSQHKSGELLDVIGPLGNGFPLPVTSNPKPVTSILAAGGVGVAPLAFLAEKLREIRNQKSKIKIIALLGAKTRDYILCEKEFKNFCE
ncbi:MAG: dihydroorotate dehydrogenase electron transfer subunit, partial [Candidatus Omnitrophota bacterium]